jgi:catechol 2,3-dioxygenase-like lactoylglutathione lyase family enzyme
MALQGAMIFVKDLERMTAFYTEVLGMKVVAETRLPTWVEFESAGSRFSLHAIPSDIASDISLQTPPVPRERSVTKLTFEVADVEGTLARIEAMGLPLLRRPWGGVEAIDPEGNVFALGAAAR